jgi:hypothetical protein
MGYDGPTVFGDNNLGNKDPFGLNVRSAFGNYAEAVGKDFSKLSSHFGGKTLEKDGGTWDEEKGMFVGPNAAYLNQMNKMNITRWNFRKKQLDVKNKLDAQIKEAEKERQRQIDLQKKIEAEAAAGKSLSQIGRENFTGEGQAFEKRKDTFTGGKTISSPSTPGGKYSSPRKDGGLMLARGGRVRSYFDGGLVSLRRR